MLFCSFIDDYKRSGEIYRLHLQSIKIQRVTLLKDLNDFVSICQVLMKYIRYSCNIATYKFNTF